MILPIEVAVAGFIALNVKLETLASLADFVDRSNTPEGRHSSNIICIWFKGVSSVSISIVVSTHTNPSAKEVLSILIVLAEAAVVYL
jgi:hypothetical protein